MLTLLFAAVSWLACADDPPFDAAELMKEVRAHQREMDKLRENYTFHSVRRVEEVDGQGAVKKTTVLEQEVFYVNGRQIRRLVKRGESPLSEDEDRKERNRAQKLTVEFLNKPPSERLGGGVNLINMILSVAEVSDPRAADLNGRPTLAFDFKGDPKAEAHGLRENGSKKLAGTVWIDRADRQVARLEVEFYDTFRIAGGLAGIQKGTVMKLDQSPIGEGLWMLTSNEQHMNLRVLTKKLHENIKVTNFDFKRFNVDAVEHAPK